MPKFSIQSGGPDTRVAEFTCGIGPTARKPADPAEVLNVVHNHAAKRPTRPLAERCLDVAASNRRLDALRLSFQNMNVETIKGPYRFVHVHINVVDKE